MWLNLGKGSSLKQKVYHRPFDTSVDVAGADCRNGDSCRGGADRSAT